MILIVGADQEETDLLQTLLASDFPLLIANSSQEALEMAKRHPAELAILGSGASITETYDILLKLLSLREDISILLIADSQHQQVAMPLVQTGLAAFLEKPFTPSDLRLKIQQFHKIFKGQAKEPQPSAPADRGGISLSPSQEASPELDPVSMERLIMDLAHRLKNPLVAIRTFAHLLGERFNDAQFQRDFYQTMRQEVERMDTLIDQLIEFSELPNPFVGPHKVLPIVEEAIKNVTDQSRGQRVDFENGLINKMLSVQADREQLVYALVHLLTSLVSSKTRAIRPRISVCIQGATSSQGVEIILQNKEPTLQDQSQFFVLELFMAKRIIERQQGSIEWRISPEGHTSVRILLPLHNPAIQPSHEATGIRTGQLISPHTDRRKRQLSIIFRDRRTRQRRGSTQSSHFPERRGTVPAATHL